MTSFEGESTIYMVTKSRSSEGHVTYLPYFSLGEKSRPELVERVDRLQEFGRRSGKDIEVVYSGTLGNGQDIALETALKEASRTGILDTKLLKSLEARLPEQ